MSRQRLAAALASIAGGMLIAVCSTGCALDAGDMRDYEADIAAIDGDDLSSRQPFAELDSASGDEGSPDPTPWLLGSDDDAHEDGGYGAAAGPDPTPWAGDDEEDEEVEDDTQYLGANVSGPDPTPWKRTSHDGEEAEPDPQPWEASRVASSGISKD